MNKTFAYATRFEIEKDFGLERRRLELRQDIESLIAAISGKETSAYCAVRFLSQNAHILIADGIELNIWKKEPFAWRTRNIGETWDLSKLPDSEEKERLRALGTEYHRIESLQAKILDTLMLHTAAEIRESCPFLHGYAKKARQAKRAHEEQERENAGMGIEKRFKEVLDMARALGIGTKGALHG